MSVLRHWTFLANRKKIGHIQYFTKDTAIATLEDSGYVIVDYQYTCITLERSGFGWKNRIMKMPRKLFFAISDDLAVRILGGFSLLVLAK